MIIGCIFIKGRVSCPDFGLPLLYCPIQETTISSCISAFHLALSHCFLQETWPHVTSSGERAWQSSIVIQVVPLQWRPLETQISVALTDSHISMSQQKQKVHMIFQMITRGRIILTCMIMSNIDSLHIVSSLHVVGDGKGIVSELHYQ